MEVKPKQQLKKQKTFLKTGEMLFHRPFYPRLSRLENPSLRPAHAEEAGSHLGKFFF